LSRTELTLVVAPDGMARAALPAELATTAGGEGEFLVAEAGGLRSTWFFRPDAELAPMQPSFTASASSANGELRVRVEAHTLLRDLCLFADRLAGVLNVEASELAVDDMMLTVLPGESATFTVSRRDGQPLDVSDELSVALSYPVLRCIGDSAALADANAGAGFAETSTS
jgi:beta-mannosidase